MKQPVTMPALSDTMNNGRLTRWLKQPGDAVKSGEAVAEVETDKAVMEVEAFHAGYLAGPLAAVDTELPVGETIGYIADSAAEARTATPAPLVPQKVAPEVAPPRSIEAPPAPSPLQPVAVAAAAESRADGLSPRERARARHAAAAPPVAEAAAAPAAAPEPASRPPVSPVPPAPAAAAGLEPQIAAGPPFRIERAPNFREAVARNIVASVATPTFHVTARLSLEPLHALSTQQDVSLTVLLARACAAAITAHPLFNAAYTPQGLAHRSRIDIGVAVDSPDGLFTPVLRDVAGRPLSDLADDWRGLLDKVKARRLGLNDYRGATFYVSNLGTFPVVQAFDSIVPVGASAILSVAASRPDGACCTLTCDHRVVFGGDAARFLQTLGDVLAAPAQLLR